MIKTNALTKNYGTGESTVHALKNCNVTFEDGLFTAIIGTSGSGKSTLLHLLGGLDVPTSGTVQYDDAILSSMNDSKLSKFRRNNIGFVFQFFNLIQELTAQENILLPLMIDNKKADKDYLDSLVKTLGISERLKHFPTQLSGGQRQRVAIARALICKPKVLLCDEPTGNLDKKTGLEILELLEKMKAEQGQTIVMVTHDDSIAAHADRVVRIEDGEIKIQ